MLDQSRDGRISFTEFQVIRRRRVLFETFSGFWGKPLCAGCSLQDCLPIVWHQRKRDGRFSTFFLLMSFLFRLALTNLWESSPKQLSTKRSPSPLIVTLWSFTLERRGSEISPTQSSANSSMTSMKSELKIETKHTIAELFWQKKENTHQR